MRDLAKFPECQASARLIGVAVRRARASWADCATPSRRRVGLSAAKPTSASPSGKAPVDIAQPSYGIAMRSLPEELEPSHLGAFIEDLEVALDSVAPDFERMRLAGTARRQHPDLGSCVVELRLVRHQNGGAGRSRSEFVRRIDVSVEMRHVVHEVELRASRKRYRKRLAVILHVKDHGDRAGRMARHQHEGHRPAAKRDLLAVLGDEVPLGLAVRKPVDGLFDHLPITFADDDPRAKALLHELGAADLTRVGVGNDHVFHAGGVETKLSQPADDDLLGFIFESGIDQDDSVRRRERPRRSVFGSDEIYVIESLRRLGIPALAIRWRRSRFYVRRRSVARRDTECAEQAWKVEPGRLLGGSEMGIDRIGGRLRAGWREAENCRDRKRECDLTFHRKLPDIRCRRAAVRRFAGVKPPPNEGYTICRPGKRSTGSDLSNVTE